MMLRGYCTRCHGLHTWTFPSQPEDKGVKFEVTRPCPRCQKPIELTGKEQA